MDHKWVSRHTCVKTTVVPKPFRGLRVLLVDNDTASLLYIASVLQEQSYNVRTIELASVALSMLREQPDQFDVVLADLNMPEMDNFEFLKQIQLIRDMPIILMSSKIEMDVVWEAKREGACFVLEKPISVEHLKNIWQHVYRKRRCQLLENKNANAEKEVNGEAPSVGVSKIANGNDLLINISGKQKEIESEVNSVAIETDKPQGSKRKCTEDEDGDEEGSEGGDLEFEQSYSKGLQAIEVVERDRNDKDNGNTEKRSRFSWTPDIHLKFIEAMTALGTKEARPKKVLEMMNVPNLTQRQVASHLQKYRDRIHRDSDTRATLPSWPWFPSTMTKSTSNFCDGNGFLQLKDCIDNFTSVAPKLAYSIHSGQSSRSSDPLLDVHHQLHPTQPSDARYRLQNGLSQEMGFVTQKITSASSPTPNKRAVNSIGTSQVPPLVYDDVMKILEGEEEVEDFNDKLTTSDVDRYCEWLGTHLLGSSCSSDKKQSRS